MSVEAAIPGRNAAGSRRRPGWSALLPWILPLILLALWQASLTFGFVAPYQLTPPADVLRSAADLWRQGVLQSDIVATVTRVVLGFALGTALAVLLGSVTGLSIPAQRAVEPTLQGIRSIPTLAWGPLLLLWLGIDDAPKVILVAIGAFFPVYVNLVAGIRSVDRKLVEVARIYDLSRFEIARRVILPAALPNLFTGLRLAFSQAWLFVVVAELFGASRGLGFLLTDSEQLTRVDLMLVAMLCLAVLGKVTDAIIVAIERRALRWRDTIDAGMLA